MKWRILNEALKLEASGIGMNALLDINLSLISPSKIKKIRVASVLNVLAEKEIKDTLGGHFGVQPCFAKTEAETTGLTNSYSKPEKMGVDRWSAALAAFHLVNDDDPGSGLCVIDAGSALTIDCIRGASHYGGYILPGYQMQVNALLDGTGKVYADTGNNTPRLTPATDTEGAVHAGVLIGMVGAIERAVNCFTDLHGINKLELFICGGDAPWLIECSSLSIQWEPDLVLDGLKYLCE